MANIAFLFAGQGAQHPGMCEDLIASVSAAAEVFEMADAIRPGTTEQCLHGTEEELRQTLNTQPCVFAADLACARALESFGVVPRVACGFSLGEVAALTFAGALSDEAGFRLVCKRAELMEAAATQHPGEMRAVLKLDADTVTHLAQEVEDVWPVNFNSPQQTVVAGMPEALTKFDELVRANKGRSMPVAVSGAFHSPLMNSAAEGLAQYMSDAVQLSEPKIPVVANRSASPYPKDSEDVRKDMLATQVNHPVQWVKTLMWCKEQGINAFVEVGPGSTLTGLVKRTLSDVSALPCESYEQLQAVVSTHITKE